MTSTIIAEMTEFKSDGVAIRAFLARPEGEESQRSTVIIIQEWWGLIRDRIRVSEIAREPIENDSTGMDVVAGQDLGGPVPAAVVDESVANPRNPVGGEYVWCKDLVEAREQRRKHALFVVDRNDEVRLAAAARSMALSRRTPLGRRPVGVGSRTSYPTRMLGWG